MSDGRTASSEVYLLVNLFSKLYVTFILQWIAFIFGRDEEEDQQMCHMQERQLSLSCYVLISPDVRGLTFG